VPICLAALCSAVSPALAAEPPRRVVSLNLCTDQLLVRLAPDRIAALSPLARDPAISAVAAEAARYPAVRASAEAVLRLRPDLVLGGDFGAERALAALRARGVAVVTVGFPADFAGIRQELRSVGERLGVSPAAEAEISAMDRTLAAVPPAPTGPRPTALGWEPRGYTSGPGGIEDAVLRAAGFANTGDGRRWGIERLLAHKPDLLVLPEDPAFPSFATDLLDNPALSGIRRVRVPPAWLICAGPATARAVALIAAAQ
jgi:iron complex transport system substrate-binding protein